MAYGTLKLMSVDPLVSGFLLALTAAVLTTAGNRLLLSFQTRAKVREELRQFVRDLHLDTVDTVADLDLLMREIGSATLVGPKHKGGREEMKAIVDTRWEQDLLRRMRRLRFGHPDPDVRAAAEIMEDEMWPFVTLAQTDDDQPVDGPLKPPSRDERSQAYGAARNAMATFRLAVYTAPRRDVPRRHNFNGEDPPSRLSRALEAEGKSSAATSDRLSAGKQRPPI